MKPLSIAQSYDAIAERWQSEEFPVTNGILQHERAISFVRRKQRAIDVGCGCSARIGALLLQHGFRVEGVDLSERMIALAQSAQPGITFHHCDICELEFTDSYDLISAWDSIWHLQPAAQEQVLRKLFAALAPEGVCIFTAGGLDLQSEKTDEAMGVPMYYSTLGIPRYLELIAACDCVLRHFEYDQLPEPHVYLIAQKKEDSSLSKR